MSTVAFFVVVHLLALGATPALVQPGFDLTRDAADRASYIAENAWLWRLGWLPWQLSAASDLLVSVALIRWLRVRPDGRGRTASLLALFSAIVAAVPEQLFEFRLVTSHVDLARRAVDDRAALADFEAAELDALAWTSVWGASFYLLMTIAWHVALRAAPAAAGAPLSLGVAGATPGAPTPHRGVGVGDWLLVATVVWLGAATVFVGLHVWTSMRPALAIAVAGGVGFALLCIWMLVAVELAARAHYPPSHDYDLHAVRWPTASRGRFLAPIAGSRGVRDLLGVMPFVPLSSDITDVVYLNWLVPTEAAQRVLPEPLVPLDLGGMTPVSVLTYRHGHFGPSLLGPLRRLMPSPLQSNWRLYLDPTIEGQGAGSIYFFKTVLSQRLFVLAARLLARGLPAHFPGEFTHESTADQFTTKLRSGGGSAPSLTATVTKSPGSTDVAEEWGRAVGDWRSIVDWLVPQNGGIQVDPATSSLVASSIDIPIDLDAIVPATIDSLSVAGIPPELAPPGSIARAVAFVVPDVSFRATGEREISGPQPSDGRTPRSVSP